MRLLSIAVERWPIAGTFTIARGSKTEAAVVVVTLEQHGARGRGECVPYGRYGESIESVVSQIEAMRTAIVAGLDREGLQAAMPAGAARNAVDCALWDLEAKRLGTSAARLAGCDRLPPAVTAFTLSLGEPDVMARAAAAAAHRPILKVKLGTPDGDRARILAIRAAAPDATLIVDANEGWRADTIADNFAACAEAGVALIEQPLPAGDDALLARIPHPVPICADESMHDRAGLDALVGRYEAVNIKLDKTGGLTEALLLADAAAARGLALMIGCMVGTSLSMAPAMLLTPRARFVDLDGPLLLANDRPDGLVYHGSVVQPPTPALWG